MKTFREAVDARDLEAIEAMLDEQVVFRSPVVFKPYPGKAITSAILAAVIEVLEDFHYVREFVDGHQHAYVFEAKVDGLAISGCDFLVFNDAGKIVDFTVMVRPLKAAQALAAKMGERYAAIESAALAKLRAGS